MRNPLAHCCLVRVEGVLILRLGPLFFGCVRHTDPALPSCSFFMIGWAGRGTQWRLGNAWVELRRPVAEGGRHG